MTHGDSSQPQRGQDLTPWGDHIPNFTKRTMSRIDRDTIEHRKLVGEVPPDPTCAVCGMKLIRTGVEQVLGCPVHGTRGVPK